MKLLLRRRAAVTFLSAVFVLYCIQDGLPASETLTIVYTNSLNGYLDYCHCKEDPKGGLVKRSTAVRILRSKNPAMVLVETGDFLTYEEDVLLAEYIVRAYGLINYDAIAPGDQEFSAGMDFFLKMKNLLPLVCGNMGIRIGGKSEPAAARTRLIRRGGLIIGIMGTISPEAFKYYPASLTKKVTLTDQAAEARKDAASLKKQGADIIILLSHSGYDRDVELAALLPEVDIIVGGHSQTLLKKPQVKGKTVIVQAGANGAHIGVLKIAVENGKITVLGNEFLLPDDSQPADDSQIRKLIDEYEGEVRKKYDRLRLK